MSRYYIIQKDGHRYDFYNIKAVNMEYTQNGAVPVLVISGQFYPRQRFRTIRILPMSVERTNIKDIETLLLGWTA